MATNQKHEKFEATLVEQKRNYQRHLRTLQRKLRNDVSKGCRSFDTEQLNKRRKCFGITAGDCEVGRKETPDVRSLPSLMPSSQTMASFNNFSPEFYPPYLVSQMLVPRVVPTRIVQLESKSEKKKSSFCVESLLSS